jgi:hypothetical protein
MKIISGVLILVTVFLNFKDGWTGISNNPGPDEAAMLNGLNLSRNTIFVFSLFTIAAGILVIFPGTFFAANLLNAVMILLIIAVMLKAGNLKVALIEIPFLLMPLILIYLGHPMKK